MKTHYLQHVPFEELGSIKRWLVSHKHRTSVTRLYQKAVFPAVADIDFLIVMGGPMSVNDERAYPWLIKEKRFIRSFIDTGKPVLGICLGAQLIAAALGARVYPNPVKEIGWFPVYGQPAPADGRFAIPASITVFHWHGETFDLPAGARHFARSEACINQAFELGDSVIGLQFHLETTEQSTRQLINNCREELIPGPFIQEESSLLSVDARVMRESNALMDDLLAFLTGGHKTGQRA